MLRYFFLTAALLFASAAIHAQTIGGPGTPHPKCLTPLFLERQFSQEKLPPSLLEALAGLCSGPSDGFGRPIKSNSILSPLGRFRVHFDVSGRDSVSVRDADGNDIPDYIDSVAYYLEYAWTVEVDQYGFAPPPSDRRGPGPEIDIYICELSAEYYGGAQFEVDNVVGTDPNRVAGYLVLDNDYRGYPTPGIPGLRVTTAHELHHLIQFGSYRIALPPFDPIAQYTLYESTATWFEKQVHPTILDYRQYVDAFLRAPHLYAFSTHTVNDNVSGYAHMLYLEYLNKRFGTSIVREIWDQFRSADTYAAIDRALARYDFNLSRSYCEFAQWSYYTGYRARDTTLLREAPQLPALRGAGNFPLEGESTSIEGSLFPLSFGLYRLVVPALSGVADTVDFLVTNSRSDIGTGGPNVRQESFLLEVSKNPTLDYVPLPRASDTLYYRLSSATGTSRFCLDAIDDSVNVVLAIRTSPQPYLNRPGEDLLFAVSANGEQVRQVKVWIYSVSGVRVAELDQSNLQVRDNQIGVLWSGKDHHGTRVPSGVYLYEISVNGGTPILGKFAVVREE